MIGGTANGTAGYGDYESMEGDWGDVCGVIDLDTDYTGTIELWDEDYTRSDPMASAQVSLSESGTGEHGTVMSEGGWFTNVTLEHADWIVDPGLLAAATMKTAMTNSTMTFICARGVFIGKTWRKMRIPTGIPTGICL